tara:strand:- start:312 stop:914 length:603 start_codon:yes stop_codon:yes gene_type:complete
MSFGAGSSGALPNHEHTNIALDGGPLDFSNTTIASLSAGSTTFSNGAALQELVIGTPAQALVVNGAGTAPEWGSAAGGTSANVQDQANFSTTSVVPVDITNYSLTLPNTGGTNDCIVVFDGVMARTVADAYNYALVKNVTSIGEANCEPNLSGYNMPFTINTVCDGDGDTLKATMHTAGGNSGTFKSGTENTSGMTAFAV